MSTTNTPNGGEGTRQAGTRPEERDTGSVRQEASSFAERARREAAGLGDAAKERAREAFDQQRDAGADRVHDVARAARSAADDLERSSPELARYTREAASAVDEFSDAIKNRSLGDVVRSVDSFARREPVAFFGTALAAGFALSRFLGSSAPRQTHYDDHDERYGGREAGAGYGAGTGSRTGASAYGTEASRHYANETVRHPDTVGSRPMTGSGSSSGSRADASGGIASGTAAGTGGLSGGGLGSSHGTAQPSHVQSPAGTPNVSSTTGSGSTGTSSTTSGSASSPSSTFSTSGGGQPSSSTLKSGPSVPVTAQPEDGVVKSSIGTGKDPDAARKAGEAKPGTDGKH